MERLSLVLWRERELLETLLFKLELEQLVMSQGRTRWLMRCAREIDAVVGEIRETEVLRAAEADAAATSCGLRDNSSLRSLAEAAPEPWQTILLEHRDAFEALTLEIEEVAQTNRGLLAAGLRSSREAMLLVASESPATYAADGTTSGVGVPVHRGLVDRSL